MISGEHVYQDMRRDKRRYSLFDRVHAALHWVWRAKLSTLRGRKYGDYGGPFSEKAYDRARRHIGKLLKIRRKARKNEKIKIATRQFRRVRAIYTVREGAFSGWQGH